MKSPNYFLIKPKADKRYNNTVDLAGIEVLVSNSIEDGLKTNREGVVVETPIGYNGDVKKGDTIIVHHNTFRLMRNQRGEMVNSMKHIKDNLFYTDDYYLRIDKNEVKSSRFPYVFMKPIIVDDELLGTIEHQNIGEVVFDNPKLNEIGIKNGNRYTFKDFRNVVFEIDGEKYFRMKYKDLLTEI